MNKQDIIDGKEFCVYPCGKVESKFLLQISYLIDKSVEERVRIARQMRYNILESPDIIRPATKDVHIAAEEVLFEILYVEKNKHFNKYIWYWFTFTKKDGNFESAVKSNWEFDEFSQVTLASDYLRKILIRSMQKIK